MASELLTVRFDLHSQFWFRLMEMYFEIATSHTLNVSHKKTLQKIPKHLSKLNIQFL